MSDTRNSSSNPQVSFTHSNPNPSRPHHALARKPSVSGKYSGRDNNTNHSRWTINSDSVGPADGVIQPGYSGSNAETDGLPSPDSSDGSPVTGNATASLKNGSTLGQRGFSSLGDGIQSLPSLKASGLLDSWGSRTADLQNQNTGGASQKQHSVTSPLRTTPPGNLNLPPHHSSLHSDGPDLRAHTTLAMPVGLQWLANESR